MQESKKHIVVITKWFPPKKGVAVGRMLSFAKYLDQEVYDITVLCDGNGEVEEVVQGVKVVRVHQEVGWIKPPIFNERDGKVKHSFKVVRNLAYLKLSSKKTSKWVRDCVHALEQLNTKQRIDVVLSSYAPEAVHEVAYAYKKKNVTVKWVADMRDEMSQYPLISDGRKQYLEDLEKKYAQLVDAVTSVSKPLLDGFKLNMGTVKRWEEVRNGFDFNVQLSSESNSVFTLTYAGTFYASNKPDKVLKVIDSLLSTAIIADIKIRFIGTPRNFTIPSGLQDKIEFLPKTNYADAMKLCASSDANFLMLHFPKRKGVYSGKLFDYLGAGKPIFAVLDKTDVAAKLLKGYHSCVMASYGDDDEIEKALVTLYTNWKTGNVAQPVLEDLMQFHRKEQVEKLNALIGELLNEG